MAGGLGKKLGQLKQWTETAEEFKVLKATTEVRIDHIKKIHDIVESYIGSLDKRKDNPLDRSKRSAVDAFSAGLIAYGSSFSDDTPYGTLLMKAGQAHEKISASQMELVIRAKDGYFANLVLCMDDIKEYDHLKKKLENRRLDFDAKLNKIQKSKKESADLEDECRMAQRKYEETLQDLVYKMEQICDHDVKEFDELVSFLDAELTHYTKVVQYLQELKDTISQMPKMASRAPSPEREERKIELYHSRSKERLDAEGLASNQDYRERREVTRSGSKTDIDSYRGEKSGYPGAIPLPVQHSRGPSATPTSNPTYKYRARSMYNFDAAGPGEISIRKGDIILVYKELNEGWSEGEVEASGQRGMFPSNYCETIPDAQPPLPFRPDAGDSYHHRTTSNDPYRANDGYRGGHDSSNNGGYRGGYEQERPRTSSNDRGVNEQGYNRGPSYDQQQYHSRGPSYDPPQSHAAAPPYQGRTSQTHSRSSSSGHDAPQNRPEPPQPLKREPTYDTGRPTTVPAARGPPPPVAPKIQRDPKQFVPPSVTAAPPPAYSPPCSICSCQDFTPHSFKEGQCANCYHRH